MEGLGVKCTILLKGKTIIIKVCQEGSRNNGTDPGEGAGIWEGAHSGSCSQQLLAGLWWRDSQGRGQE